jgi:RND family efflux transporter MFP subunit
MRIRKTYLVIGIICVVVAAILVYLLAVRGGRKQERTGETFVVKPRAVTSYVEQTGIVKAQVGSIVKVGTRSTGTLVDLRYQVGDQVKMGELIARIDDREILANIRNARASIEEAKRDVDVKEAQHRYNITDHERQARLLEKEFIARDSLDRARREMDVSGATVELSRARLEAAKERLKQLEVNLSYTKIYAPITGIVSSVTTQQGETVVAGLSAPNLITIIDPTKLEMWIYVDETDIGRVKPGMKVEHWVDAYRDKRFQGKIDMVYPQPEIRENIVYYLAIVKIDPKDTLFLKPEMTTHVRIMIEQKDNVLAVPNAAVRFEDGKNVVYVKKGDKSEQREVTVGVRDERFTEIVSGLGDGQQIIVPVMKKPAQANQGSAPGQGTRK